MNDRMMEKQNTADTDTLLIPTTRVVHERNVAVAEGCQMIVLTQTPNLPCFSVWFGTISMLYLVPGAIFSTQRATS